MQDTMKIGAAALGGYVLGRTKKAKAAISLALWLSGRGRAGDFVRSEATRLLQSEQARALVGQGREAALSMFENRAGRLGDALERRTEELEIPGKNKERRAGRSDDDRYDDDRYDDRADEDEDEYDDEYDDADEEEDEEEDDEYEDEYEDENEYDDGDADEDSDVDDRSRRRRRVPARAGVRRR